MTLQDPSCYPCELLHGTNEKTLEWEGLNHKRLGLFQGRHKASVSLPGPDLGSWPWKECARTPRWRETRSHSHPGCEQKPCAQQSVRLCPLFLVTLSNSLPISVRVSIPAKGKCCYLPHMGREGKEVPPGKV